MEIDPSEKHPQYDAMVDTWQMCRDCVTGQRAVHAARDTYLPMLSGQERKQYDAYLKRALYMNATGRTVEGMVGMVFRKYPTIALPDALKEIELDIDMSGVSLAGKAQDIVTEVIKVGRAGILVDMPQAGETEEGVAPTISQTREQGIRPYLAMYKAEDILNWTYERVNNQTQLTQVFLAEIDETGAHDFQVRELFLEGGVYGQRIWRKQQSGWKNGGDIFPLIGGKAITRIPFWFCQPNEGGADVQDSPIEDLCYVNLAHYRNSADLENGAHVAGLPTPWVNGVDDPTSFPTLHLGSDTVLILPTGSQTGILQCGSEGFATIEKAMDRKENQMAALGARMLAQEKRATETAEALEIKRGGENSVLASLAATVENALTSALRFMAEWQGADPSEAAIELNKDYFAQGMDAQMLTAWVAAWQQGAISYPTFFAGLQRGEMVPESLTAEDEMEQIGNAEPLGMIGDDGQ